MFKEIRSFFVGPPPANSMVLLRLFPSSEIPACEEKRTCSGAQLDWLEESECLGCRRQTQWHFIERGQNPIMFVAGGPAYIIHRSQSMPSFFFIDGGTPLRPR